MRVLKQKDTTYNHTTDKKYEMNLPKLEPIVWKKSETIEKAEVFPTKILYIPLPPPDDIRHDYIGVDGLLHIYYPGIPELN